MPEKILLSILYSYLGCLVEGGSVDALKFLYCNLWRESPPLIRTVNQLLSALTGSEIEAAPPGRYSDEFLYYWGMTCLGHLSNLTAKKLATAEICFEKISSRHPLAKARLAYLELLETDEPAKSESNVKRIDVLRKWASKGDLFSCTACSKIVFSQYLSGLDEPEEDPKLPTAALTILQSPLQYGHPTAVRFYRDLLVYTGRMPFEEETDDSFQICEDVLLDFAGPEELQQRRFPRPMSITRGDDGTLRIISASYAAPKNEIVLQGTAIPASDSDPESYIQGTAMPANHT